MAREASASDLVYISSFSSGSVYVYTYPGGKRVGALTGLWQPIGECVDGSGDVFVVTQGSRSSDASSVYEYSHGGSTPIAILSDPGYAMGCAVDPATGSLAVANPEDTSNPYYHDRGDVAVYASAQGEPVMYYSSLFVGFGFCGYDSSSNLYLDGETYGSNQHVALARLPSGGTTISLLNLDKGIYGGYEFTPSVQWDGQHMTVSTVPRTEGRKGSGLVSVYRIAISGSTGTVIGRTKLEALKNRHRGQSWIFGSRVLGIYQYKGYENVAAWSYPKGGKPQDVILRSRLSGFWAAVVSPAQ